MYGKEFLDSISRVESNRKENLSFSPPVLSEDQREKLVGTYHPNFKSEAFSIIESGANKGDAAPIELCRLLCEEQDYKKHIDINSPSFSTDVLVIGGGGAGASAAIEAAKSGAKVLIATALRFGVSNTIMAKGGIQAVTESDDSVKLHFEDSFKSGGQKANCDLLKQMVACGPETIDWLSKLGVKFDTTANGKYNAILGGGTSKKRILSCKDSTGAEIMRALKQEVERLGIETLPFMPAVQLILGKDKKIEGAILQNAKTKEFFYVLAKAVIIATGGAGKMNFMGFPSSNHQGALGQGLRLAYGVGAELTDIESFQYHPTGVAYPNSLFGTLITEKARSLGAKLVNRDGKVFINPLESRDVCAAAIIKECATNGVKTPDGFAVWLDTPMIDQIHSSGTTEKNLPQLYHSFKNMGIDICKEPILVYPTLHYQNGGIKIDADGLVVGFDNLFAAGEVTGGIHGKNRLMGNALLDIIVFGRKAGQCAASKAL